MSKQPLTFGTIVIDKLHMFFGHSSPSAFVIADMWANESDGDEECWVDHYRAHVRKTFKELRNEEQYAIVGIVDLSSGLSAREQCEFAEIAWTKDNREWIDARTAEQTRRLAEKRS